MKITLEALKTLEAIHRYGSFAAAAKALYKVPSALTYTISTLEQAFNEPLFDRSGHKAVLTPLGEKMLAEGLVLLDAAAQLEKSVKLFQSGWEESITIAYDQLIPFQNLLPLIESFYEACPEVNLKVTGEVLGGCWDALFSDRASLAIGVSGEPLKHDDYAVIPLGQIEFVFLVAAEHPLAHKNTKLTKEDIKQYRSIVVADTARVFVERNSGILPEQKRFTVSTFQEKIDAMLKGLGIGYLPLTLAQRYIDSGDLVVKRVDKLKSIGTLATAWRPSLQGKGMEWFIEQLSDKRVCSKLLANVKGVK